MSPADRLLSKVDKTETCWLWTGSLGRNGYGRFRIGSRRDGSRREVGAHRFAYEVLVGPIPEGLTLDHLCHVRHCVNPEHLEPVTMRENILRGAGLSAQQARRTHCPKGHALDMIRHGKRECRRCRNEGKRRSRQRRAGLLVGPPAGNPLALSSALAPPGPTADTQSGRGRAEQAPGEGRQDSATTPRPDHPEGDQP